jgi:ribosomal protein L40E
LIRRRIERTLGHVPHFPRPDDWWRDPTFREELRRLDAPEYWLARLERDRALFDASGGWDSSGRATQAEVELLRKETERARTPFADVVDTWAVLARRRKTRKAVAAFMEAVRAEIREYETMIRDPVRGVGGDPDDEHEMERLLERFERDERRRVCPWCLGWGRRDSTRCRHCGHELDPGDPDNESPAAHEALRVGREEQERERERLRRQHRIRICVECHEVNPHDATVCRRCGHELEPV